MSKIIKKQITIPKMTKQGYRQIQEGGCSDETDCRDLNCKDCIYSAQNLDHFIRYFDLDEVPGTITVNETERKEEIH